MADESTPKAPTAKQKRYATWLTAGGYCPFAAPVAGYNGMLRTVAVHNRSRGKGAAKEAAEHALEQFALADAVVAGDRPELPAGWPGKRPLAIQKAREAAKE